MSNWIASAVGKMHINKISNIELAKKMNVTPQYISMILNGKKSTKNAESRINDAIDSIISEQNA